MIENSTAKLLEWRYDPVKFIEEVFGEYPDKIQRDILTALANHPRVAVRSGHGIGKTWTAARASLWFLLTHPYAKVITTAPTAHQVKKILWSEIHSAINKMPMVLRNSLDVLDVEVYVKDVKNRRIKDWFLLGRSSDKPEYMQGFHAQNLMFILDEASGIDNNIYEAIQGSQTTNAKMLLIGNPTRPEGFFYDVFHKNNDLWKTFHVSCYDSSRVRPEWIKQMIEEWGVDSAVFKVRVLGDFPEIAENTLFPLNWVETAIHINVELTPPIKYRIGIDVAREGFDETVLTVVAYDGFNVKVVTIDSESKRDLVWTVSRAKKLFKEYNAEMIIIDDVGVGGGVTDMLKAEGYPVNPIKFGASPTNNTAKGIFYNLKAQIYYELREFFDPSRPAKIQIPDNHKLVRDLTALKQDYTSTDKLKIVKPSKSPDYADSLALAVTNVNLRGGAILPPSKYLKQKEDI